MLCRTDDIGRCNGGEPRYRRCDSAPPGADGFGVSLLATRQDLLTGICDEIRAGGGSAEVVVCDLADREQLSAVCERLVADHPAIHALVNNAGIVRIGAVSDFDGDDWDDVMEINVRATFEMVRALEPALRAAAATGASVVNVSSVMSLVVTPTIVSYLASKGAVNTLTRGLAVELGPAGIRVNAIAPGYIRTDSSRRRTPRAPGGPGQGAPARPVGTPEEVAAVVSFLCSDDASFVSGTILSVDGGLACVAAIPSKTDE